MSDSKEKQIDHEGTDDVVCPYCGEVHQGSDFLEDEAGAGKHKCYECDKEFIWEADFSVTFSTRPAD